MIQWFGPAKIFEYDFVFSRLVAVTVRRSDFAFTVHNSYRDYQ
jgi:hypothetical protein